MQRLWKGGKGVAKDEKAKEAGQAWEKDKVFILPAAWLIKKADLRFSAGNLILFVNQQFAAGHRTFSMSFSPHPHLNSSTHPTDAQEINWLF